jgi:hypothetical protein
MQRRLGATKISTSEETPATAHSLIPPARERYPANE